MPTRREALAGVAGTGLAALAGCSLPFSGGGGPEWPTYRDGPRNLGRSAASVASSAPTDTWERQVGEYPSGLVRQGDTVYCGSGGTTANGRVYALDVSSGDVDWQYDLQDDEGNLYGTPAIVDDLLVVPVEGALLGLDRTDGSRRWRRKYSMIRSPAVADGSIYVAGVAEDDGGVVYRVGTDGEERWRRTVESPVIGAPAVADGTVYVADSRDALYALDPSDGSDRWRRDIAGGWFGSPAVADGEVYLADRAGVVHSFGTDGSERWTRSITERDLADAEGESLMSSTPAVTDDGVFVAGHTDPLFALERSDGSVRWEVDDDGFHNSGPIAVGDAVYFPGRDIRAIDQTSGETRWRTDHDVNLRLPVAVDGGVLASKYTENTVVRLDA